MTPHSSESSAVALEGASELQAAQTRLKTGRNERCPCGSGKKYKKCCLTGDEYLVRVAAKARQAGELAAVGENQRHTIADRGVNAPRALREPSVPGALGEEVEDSPGLTAEAEDLWQNFLKLAQPTTEQMDEFLARLIALPPEATQWSDVLHRFSRSNHGDLPGVFRRISDSVPHTKDNGIAFLYWAAAEEFVRHGLSQLLPEVAARFQKLDRGSYDSDALSHVEEYLLVEGFEDEALRLAEHFLPIERADDGLMPWAVPHRCQLIFELRVGQALRNHPAAGQSAEQIAEWVHHDIEEEIHADSARYVAEIVVQTSVPAWAPSQFELVPQDHESQDPKGKEDLRLFGTLIRVAQEAWQVEKELPGRAVRGLSRLLDSVYYWRNTCSKPSKKRRDNLLDYIRPTGLEQRLVRSCTGMLGINVARARLLIHTHELLTRLAARHELIPPWNAAQTQKELLRLRNIVNGSGGEGAGRGGAL